MSNPQYKRLIDSDGHFVGFERTIIEFNPAGQDFWQLEPIDYDPSKSINLDGPAVGIASLRRPKVGKK